MKSTDKIFSSSLCIPYGTLVAYHEEKLTAREQHDLEQHLIDCDLCSEALEGIALLKQPVNADDLKARFQSEILKETQSPRTIRIGRMWYAAAAAFAILFLSVVVYRLLNTTVPEKNLAVQQTTVKKAEEPVAQEPFPNQPVIANYAESVTEAKKESPDQANKVDASSKIAGTKVTVDETIREEKAAAENFNVQSFGDNTLQVSEAEEAEKDVSKRMNDVAATAARAAEVTENEGAAVNFYSSKNISGNISYIADYKVMLPADERAKPAAAKEKETKKKNVEAQYENAAAHDSQIVVGSAKAVEPSYAQILERALLNLKSGAFEKAGEDFKFLLGKNPNDLNALFYQGICFYEISNTHAAAASFTKVRNAKDITFREEADWYLALTFNKAGNRQKAKELMTKIASEKGFYSEKAKLQLGSLE